MNIAQAIAVVLLSQGHRTQIQQAERVGEVPQTWCKYLKGKTRPLESKIDDWADLAGVDLHLVDGKWSATAKQ